MIHGYMSAAKFVVMLWEHKIKVAMVMLALIFGPEFYEGWQSKRAVEKLEADRKAVDRDASIAGMMLANAWTSCKEIGIVNNLEGCAAYKGRLLQEIAAPQLAKTAIEYRDAYHRHCQKFNAADDCNALLARSLQLSIAQNKSATSD